MMKKISRRSFLQVCGITAATAALTACGGGKTETAKKDDVHEAITFMAPYKEIEAFIEQVHSVYPEVNIEVVPYSGDNTTTCLQNMFAAGDLPDVCTLTYYDPRIDLVSDKLLVLPESSCRDPGHPSGAALPEHGHPAALLSTGCPAAVRRWG